MLQSGITTILEVILSNQFKRMTFSSWWPFLLMLVTHGVFAEDLNSCDIPVHESGSFYEFFAKQVERREVGSVRFGRSRSCLKDATQLRNIKNLLVVDVRPEGSYQKGHIPGAVNLPLYQLKSKALFKNKPLLIVESKAKYFDHLELCERLPLLGFKEVYLLNGGHESWVASIAGGSASDLKVITPLDFINIQEKRAWIVLDFSARENTFSEGIVQFKDGVSKKEFEELLNSKVDSFVKRYRFQPNLLVVSESGNNYQELQVIISNNLRESVFYLDGGLSAFDKTVVYQNKIRTRKRLTTDTGELRCR